MKLSTFCSALATLSLTISCSKPKLDSLVKDDSFTYDRLQLGHLLIAPPINSKELESEDVKKMSAGDRRKVTGSAVSFLRKEREGLNVKPLYAHKRSSKSIVKKLQTILNKDTPLQEKDFEFLSKTYMKFPDPYRYIFVPKIDSDRTWRDAKNYNSEKKTVVELENGQQKEIREVYQHKELYSLRSVSLNGYVIDMKHKAIVWDGLTQQRSANKNASKKLIQSNSSRTYSTISFDRLVYPADPELNRVLTAAMWVLMMNLPDPDDD